MPCACAPKKCFIQFVLFISIQIILKTFTYMWQTVANNFNWSNIFAENFVNLLSPLFCIEFNLRCMTYIQQKSPSLIFHVNETHTRKKVIISNVSDIIRITNFMWQPFAKLWNISWCITQLHNWIMYNIGQDKKNYMPLKIY